MVSEQKEIMNVRGMTDLWSYIMPIDRYSHNQSISIKGYKVVYFLIFLFKKNSPKGHNLNNGRGCSKTVGGGGAKI